MTTTLDTFSAAFNLVLTHEAEALADVVRRLDENPEAVEAACRVLSGAANGTGPRVITSGVGKAGIIARKVAATLSSTGTAAVFLHAIDGLHGDLGFARPGDCGLLFSYSGETVEVVRLAKAMRAMDCPLVTITRSQGSALGETADCCIEIGDVPEACHLGLAPSSSTTVMLAVGDALALAVAKHRGFGERDFARNHPGGMLGLRFREVREFLRTGLRLVCIRGETPIRDAVKLVSIARTGAAIIVNRDNTLRGIFTDGDLRRAILRGNTVLDERVDQFGSIPCRHVFDDDSVADALKLFHELRIEDLPAVDRTTSEVCGLLCLKDVSPAG
jgi:arabinose-5-phosphate isomerase